MKTITSSTSSVPKFSASYAPEEGAVVDALLSQVDIDVEAESNIRQKATDLVRVLRQKKSWVGDVDDFLHAYGLSTDEGLALMVMAESLLRIPDSMTADQLIEDKLGSENWNFSDEGKPFVAASTWALAIGAKLTAPEDATETAIQRAVKRVGKPAVRTATRQAMKILGRHFVLGQTIKTALKKANRKVNEGYRFSFDMLGEGARTSADAERYFESYRGAIEAIGKAEKKPALPERAGISVKLSALHPKYHEGHIDAVMQELAPQVLSLAELAKSYDLNFTIDAEEAERLALSLDVFAAVASSPSLADWDGFGLAVQAYQKRSLEVIDWVISVAEQLDRKFMVRLVKGAYWDTEIKRAQEEGIDDYPVFTRKASNDLAYTICAQKIAAAKDRVFGQFATHNALTAATVSEICKQHNAPFEFQCLHGMGEVLYEQLSEQDKIASCRIYAPVGSHEDLLAYLVRRILENGANSSFVNSIDDESIPISALIKQPWDQLATYPNYRNEGIDLPPRILGPERRNAKGFALGDREAMSGLMQIVAEAETAFGDVCSIVRGKAVKGKTSETLFSPVDRSKEIATVWPADSNIAEQALEVAAKAYKSWSDTNVVDRAQILDVVANTLEEQMESLIAMISCEAGRTVVDGISEVREAVDFCRYYAEQARSIIAEPTRLPGPTGEENWHQFIGRGVFVCISPWNFPLAIFIGQIAAALVTGNTVVAKPAEQTPAIAVRAVELFHEAGIPADVLHLVLGGSAVGAALTQSNITSGVSFTGSTETAWAINRSLAARRAPIAPMIAETGGINAMIVDATALPEQVADDVVASAFQSAGQRCSALRLLCVQDDVADRMLTIIKGAARELVLANPSELSTDMGPVIDQQAKDKISDYLNALPKGATLRFGEKDMKLPVPQTGNFIAPHIVELERVDQLESEIFGPVLHIVRFKAGKLDELIDQINASGFGLTFGVHSRIQSKIDRIANGIDAGNVYVNRNMIGAVVGVQPFGGRGLSGTGPKAGGPAYLYRFLSEKVMTTNTTAIGGNTSLVAMGQ
jgi:RHH-type proline utilization regulon transcriptional repressor/proline dehydrogenase/delta 1-pyrroline-5-carboxylate dehydrogenase